MRDTIIVALIFGLGIAAIYVFARITEKIDAQRPPDYKLKTYSYKRELKRSLCGILVVVAVSIGIYAFSGDANLRYQSELLSFVLFWHVWFGACIGRDAKSEGARGWKMRNEQFQPPGGSYYGIHLTT
jgi:hypothetical protein